MSDLGYHPSSPKKEHSGINTIRTLTIKQFQSCESDEGTSVMYLDKKELSTFKILGWASNVRTTHTGKFFLLEDGTSEIECTIWSNKTYDEQLCKLVEDGSFVKVFGTLKIFQGKKTVNVASLYVIEDYNEFLYHMTSVIYEKLAKKNNIVQSGISKVQKDLLECIRNNQDEENGINIDIILKCMQNEYNEKTIRENLDNLVDNCHLIVNNEAEYKTVN